MSSRKTTRPVVGDTDGFEDDVRRRSTDDRLLWSISLAIFVLVFVEGFLWTITRIFILNFDVAGPNATILLFVLLSTGWILAIPGRFDQSTNIIYPASALVVLAGFGVSLHQSPVVAGLGAVLMVTAATVPIVGLSDALKKRVVYGFGLGFVLTVGLRVFLDTASPYVTLAGTVIFGTAIVVALGIVGYLSYRKALPATRWRSLGRSPVVPCLLLVVAAGFLVHPQAIARWALRSYELTVVALLVGLAAGIGLVRYSRMPSDRELFGWAGLFVGSAAVLLYFSHPLTTLSYAVAWMAAIMLLAGGVRKTDRNTATVTVVSLQFVALFVLFMSIAATHWPFLTFPLDLTRGLGTEITMLFLAAYPVAVWIVLLDTGSPISRGSSLPIFQSRREMVTAFGAGLIPMGGLLTNRPDPGVDGPRDDRIRVMAYNLHIFFEERESGQYSLEAIRNVVAEDGADIIAVSESDALRPLPGYVDGLRWLGNELDYYTEFGGATKLRSYGVGFLSRWPISNIEVIELPLGRTITRLAVTATIETPQGPLPVLSTHFMVEKEDESDDARDEQARTVVDVMTAHENAVVMGDFNIRPDEPEYEILDDAFTDAWVSAKEDGNASGTAETYSAENPQRRIDYIFLQGEWQVHEAATKGTAHASDHKAVVAEIEPEADLQSRT